MRDAPMVTLGSATSLRSPVVVVHVVPLVVIILTTSVSTEGVLASVVVVVVFPATVLFSVVQFTVLDVVPFTAKAATKGAMAKRMLKDAFIALEGRESRINAVFTQQA
jgi:hypothetical protein